MSKVLVNETSLTGIADAIRGKNGKTDKYKPSEMAAAILAITGGGGGDLPEEALTITGDCGYRFANDGWNWFIDAYGDRITTKDITSCEYMFNYCNNLEEIPFDINCITTKEVPLTRIFYGCKKITEVPKINNCKPNGMSYLFYECAMLPEIPDDLVDWFDWSYMEGLTGGTVGGKSNLFYGCRSLRSIPMSFMEHANPNASPSYSQFQSAFVGCAGLDELVDLPIPHTATWTSGGFSSCFYSAGRLKNITFKMPDGQPYVKNWKGQNIDLTSSTGWIYSSYILGYNTSITADKEVKDDATYQALKNDPDWWTQKIEYSRYNHDSAVATINTLPDTSAYIASAGGTNTIKFKKNAGSKTDGGAINTLTAEEIAVASAKGWTVTLS